MTDLTPYADIEDVLRRLLQERFSDIPEANFGTDFPTDDRVPFVRVAKTPMSRRQRLNDYPVLDIEVLESTRAKAKDLIESIDTYLLGYPHSVVIGSRRVRLDMVTVPRSPAEQPWESPGVRRFAGSYQFSVRR
jgi:hypothetical protein